MAHMTQMKLQHRNTATTAAFRWHAVQVDTTMTKLENAQLKNTIGAIFVALLAAEFVLTPVLKPILVAARHSSQ
jgi:hypothetical protein